MNKTAEQKKICRKYGAEYFKLNLNLKVGISKNIKSGEMPINALRHEQVNGTTGWYIWAGNELLKEDDFFDALHAKHLEDYCPLILKYLGLPPGWRVLIDDKGYEDVWFDPSLLFVSDYL